MGPITITVQEAVPVAVPTELLHQLKVKPGDRLEWRVEGSELVVRRVRSVDSLRGCLASKVPFPGLEAEKDGIRTRSGKAHKTSSQPGQSQTVTFDGEALVKSVQSMASHVHGGRQVVLRWRTLKTGQAKQAFGAGGRAVHPKLSFD
jgi:bifunctional DNA-binding transcriptional regulator/antitoxin component of YhaV-PrlF toxin-antitoxin module